MALRTAQARRWQKIANERRRPTTGKVVIIGGQRGGKSDTLRKSDGRPK